MREGAPEGPFPYGFDPEDGGAQPRRRLASAIS